MTSDWGTATMVPDTDGRQGQNWYSRKDSQRVRRATGVAKDGMA